MNTKINELTEKIYNEGIEKANAEAKQIIENAEKKAQEIIQNAEKSEQEIIKRADKYSKDAKNNLDTELKLAARQFISNLKQQVAQLITLKQIQNPVKEALNDKELVKAIINDLISKWNPQNPEQLNLSISLADNLKKQLDEYVQSKTQEFLNNSLDIVFDDKIKTGLKIEPKDGSFIISFTDEDFSNLFQNYLKDKNKNLIFG